MRLTKSLSKVTLKMSHEDVTGKMGLSWLTHSMEHFGIRKMIIDEYRRKKKSNREIEVYQKIIAGEMMMVAGGQRVEDVEGLRAAVLLQDYQCDE